MSSTTPRSMAEKMPLQLISNTLCRGWLIPLLLIVAGPGHGRLPELGDSADQVFSRADQEAIARSIERRYADRLIQDPLLDHYVALTGQRLAVASGYLNSLRFLIIRAPSINAFAAPGGVIGINSGLIEQATLESELVAVLAHEVAHLRQQHSARYLQKSSSLNLVTIAALLGAVLLGGNSELAQATLYGGLAHSTQQSIDTIRQGEYEADRIGIAILARAGFDPNGMAGFFGRLQRQTRFASSGQPEYLRTHPVDSNRIAEAELRATTLAQPGQRRDHLDYQLFRARSLFLADESSTRVLPVRSSSATTGEQIAARYLDVLRSAHRGQSRDALIAVDRLIEQTGHHPWPLLERAEILSRLGQNAQALKQMEQIADLYPGYLPAVLAHAHLLMEQRKFEKARQLLIDHYDLESPQLLLLLARIERRSGSIGRHYATLAAYYQALGEPHEAMRQIELARGSSDLDRVERARVEARRNMIEQLIELDKEHL